MPEPKDLVVRLLRKIQQDLAAFRKESDERLSKLEAGQKNLRSAMAGETVLRHLSPDTYLRELVMLADLHHDGSPGANSALADGDRVVELRDGIAILERKVKELESHK